MYQARQIDELELREIDDIAREHNLGNINIMEIIESIMFKLAVSNELVQKNKEKKFSVAPKKRKNPVRWSKKETSLLKRLRKDGYAYKTIAKKIGKSVLQVTQKHSYELNR